MTERFSDLPLPARSEAWKYSDLTRLLRGNPDLQATAGPQPAARSLLGEDNCLVFVDGEFQAEASTSTLRPAAVDPDHTPDDDALTPLQARAAQAAYRLDLPDSTTPLHLLLLASDDAPRLSALNLDIRVAAGAAASLVIEHAGGAAGGLSLLRWEFSLGAEAELAITRCQHLGDGHSLLATQQATLAAASRMQQTHIEWGASLSRLQSRLNLAAAGASVEYHALSGLAGRQHCDHQVEVRHAAPDCRSRLRARGLVDERARQVFNGKVHVARDAQRTDSDQLLRNLLLSDQAEVDAKPELEIYADDVRCAHGATVGQLDAQALFYLRSRGLDADEARRLLLLSFAESILASIGDEALRERIRDAFAQALQLPDSR